MWNILGRFSPLDKQLLKGDNLSHWMFFLSAKEYCKVIFPYEAQNDDELTIREGDVVTLISKVKAIFFFL